MTLGMSAEALRAEIVQLMVARPPETLAQG